MASEIKACCGLATSEMWPMDRGRWDTFCGMKLVRETEDSSVKIYQINFILVYMFITIYMYIKDIESNCLDRSIRQDWFSVTLALRLTLEEPSALVVCIRTAGASRLVAVNEKIP